MPLSISPGPFWALQLASNCQGLHLWAENTAPHQLCTAAPGAHTRQAGRARAVMPRSRRVITPASPASVKRCREVALRSLPASPTGVSPVSTLPAACPPRFSGGALCASRTTSWRSDLLLEEPRQREGQQMGHQAKTKKSKWLRSPVRCNSGPRLTLVTISQVEKRGAE